MSDSVGNASYSTNQDAASDIGRQLAGKYMTFKLANEEYGLAILRVREIIGLMDITRVPRTKEFIRGVINLRGKVIPVVELAAQVQHAGNGSHRPNRDYRGSMDGQQRVNNNGYSCR